MKRVCANCFGDDDLGGWIHDADGAPGCEFCNSDDAPTCDLNELCAYIQECLEKVFGFAVDHLPYESAEGGYLGSKTWTTYEILREQVSLSLPRDSRDGKLFQAILSRLTDETWCEYDWLSLDLDDALKTSWDDFCFTVKHKRRFFFHASGEDTHDSFTSATLLKTIAKISQGMGLVRELPVDKAGLWRARTDLGQDHAATASDFGPPPLEFAKQANRMNPPGIPMLYLASREQTAVRETKTQAALVGRWVVVRPLRVLDLRALPDVPGIFSGVERNERLAIRFLHSFAYDIMQPVERDDRVHIDYLPSQVVSEFVRDFEFDDGILDGIAYGSTVDKDGWNVALYLSRADLALDKQQWGKAAVEPPMTFDGARWISAD